MKGPEAFVNALAQARALCASGGLLLGSQLQSQAAHLNCPLKVHRPQVRVDGISLRPLSNMCPLTLEPCITFLSTDAGTP